MKDRRSLSRRDSLKGLATTSVVVGSLGLGATTASAGEETNDGTHEKKSGGARGVDEVQFEDCSRVFVAFEDESTLPRKLAFVVYDAKKHGAKTDTKKIESDDVTTISKAEYEKAKRKAERAKEKAEKHDDRADGYRKKYEKYHDRARKYEKKYEDKGHREDGYKYKKAKKQAQKYRKKHAKHRNEASKYEEKYETYATKATLGAKFAGHPFYALDVGDEDEEWQRRYALTHVKTKSKQWKNPHRCVGGTLDPTGIEFEFVGYDGSKKDPEDGTKSHDHYGKEATFRVKNRTGTDHSFVWVDGNSNQRGFLNVDSKEKRHFTVTVESKEKLPSVMLRYNQATFAVAGP